jgi:hypothetical protein
MPRGEGHADPRPREMTPSDKHDILCATDRIALAVSELETVVNILDYPFAEITTSDGLLTICLKGKR